MANYEERFNKYVASCIDEANKYGINVNQINWYNVMMQAKQLFDERYVKV